MIMILVSKLSTGTVRQIVRHLLVSKMPMLHNNVIVLKYIQSIKTRDKETNRYTRNTVPKNDR